MSAPSCRCCGKPRTPRKDSPGNYAGVNGWCSACTSRWYRQGQPEDGPLAPMSHAERTTLANAGRREEAAARMAEFTRLRAARYTVAQAAWRIGVSVKTARQAYEPVLREMAARGDEAA